MLEAAARQEPQMAAHSSTEDIIISAIVRLPRRRSKAAGSDSALLSALCCLLKHIAVCFLRAPLTDQRLGIFVGVSRLVHHVGSGSQTA